MKATSVIEIHANNNKNLKKEFTTKKKKYETYQNIPQLRNTSRLDQEAF